MRGRKPKPLALKILQNETHHKRLNFLEPNYAPGPLDPPDWLDKFGVEHWNELAPILAKAGVFTEADRPALAQLCHAYSQIRNGTANRSVQAEYRRYLLEFGLTPCSRGRLRSPGGRPANALDELKKRHGG